MTEQRSETDSNDTSIPARANAPWVLVVDDDEVVRTFVERVCAKRGFRCEQAADGMRATEILTAGQRTFDVILLDVSMPGQTGWQFIERLRAGGDETPVIFLSGHREVDAKVKGLQLGADDYIEKPFDSAELMARVDAVLRRRNALPVLTLADLQLDLAHRTVSRAGRRVDLSPKEFDVLHCLVEAGGRILSKAELLRVVWGIKEDPGTKVLEVHISRLRAKIDQAEPHLIETVVRKGYRTRISG